VLIGLGQYADAFEANEIDMGLRGRSDDQILMDIGVSPVGHRLRIRNAITKMGSSCHARRESNFLRLLQGVGSLLLCSAI
jgi:hypothetical protein